MARILVVVGPARVLSWRRGVVALVNLRLVTTRRRSVPWLAVICALVLAGCVRTVAPIPVLGQLAGAFRHGEGFGNVTPSVIYNGGDNTGYVGHVVWKSWGGSRSVGSGVAEYVRPGRYPATGTEEPATVVAFKLGTCDGKLMYQALEWYFPQHGQRFNPDQYEDICTGTYVLSP